MNEAGKLIRQVLKKEAPTLSIRHDTGTAYGWINIRGSKECGYFTEQEWSVLVKYGLLTGLYGNTNCALISPDDREYYVRRITGKPIDKTCDKCNKQYEGEPRDGGICTACREYYETIAEKNRAEKERGEQERLARKVQELFPEPKLPHTDKVMQMLEQGQITEAMQKHNDQVNEQFKRAKRGEVINLSDLMAAKEQIDIKRDELRQAVQDGKDYEKQLSQAEKPLTVKVSDYQLTASNGRPIRKATKVTFENGEAVKFLEKLPKGQAIDQAEKLRYIQ